MIIPSFIVERGSKLLLKNVPVIGALGSFTNTAIEVCKCTSPSGAILTATKGILLDCTPPAIKYPVLCGTLVVCSCATVFTSFNPYVVSATIMVAEAIVKE